MAVDVRQFLLFFASSAQRVSRAATCRHVDGDSRTCGQDTREGKHYCPDHTIHHGHAARVAALVEQRERERVLLIAHGVEAVRPDMLTLGDLVFAIATRGEATIERLVREASLAEDIVQALVAWLVLKGAATTHLNARGNVVVALVHQQRASA